MDGEIRSGSDDCILMSAVERNGVKMGNMMEGRTNDGIVLHVPCLCICLRVPSILGEDSEVRYWLTGTPLSAPQRVI